MWQLIKPPKKTTENNYTCALVYIHIFISWIKLKWVGKIKEILKYFSTFTS